MYAKYTAVGLSGLFRALHQFIAFLETRKTWAFLSSFFIQILRFYNAQALDFVV
jgi:hypothetical protein